MSDEETTSTDETTESAETTESGGKEDLAGWPNKRAKERFDQINTRMKQAEQTATEAQERADALEAKIEAMVAEKASNKEEPLKAPAHLSTDEQVEWLIAQGSKKAIEKELGMPLAQAKVLLQAGGETSKQTQQITWTTLCERHGLDPNDRKVIRYARGISQEKGATPESIVKECAEVFGKKPQKKPPNSMEAGGETGVMIAEDEMPFDKRSATRAAREGRKAPYVPADELLARATKRRARAGG